MFDLIVHSDWSVDRRKRWAVVARREGGRWDLSDAEEAWPVDRLLAESNHRRVLAGFDFPIGVPAHWAARAKVESFRSLLPLLGSGSWARFFDVAEKPEDISTHRPFYPRASLAGTKREHLAAAHGAADFDALLRLCERKTEHRNAACALFWTLGGNQVGKGALSGWREVVIPTVQRGARLWPFDGGLVDGGTTGLTIAETYPGEAYNHVGVTFRAGMSKRRQSDRAGFASTIETWASKHDVALSAALADSLRRGFGAEGAGEDRFDALLGLCGMIEVVDGRRDHGAPPDPRVTKLEGWIFGQKA